jgi:hypothetical protein
MTASPLDVPTAFDYIPTEADRGLTPPKEGPMTPVEQAASDALDIPRIVYPTKTVLGDGSVLVDKTIAESWLAANTHNRKLRNFRVDQMARNMKVGQWDDNGETIKFSRTGVLLDGQHRLSAVIESDTVQVFTVIAGLDDVVQRSIDIGGKRTVGDQLNLNGKSDGKTLASVARFAMEMQAWPRSFRPSEMEIVGIVENDDKLQWVVTHVNPTLPAILGSPTVRAYVYRVLHDVDPDACATFFSKLTTLDKLPSDSPILALYRRLATPDMRKDGMRGRVAMVTCYFIAWNAWRNGEPRQIIKPHSNAEGYVMPPKPV